MKKEYSCDIVIVGAGPAGLTAAIYAARGGKSVIICEKSAVGGQAALTAEIENYPAFGKINGFELAQKMHEQAKALGVQTVYGNVQEIDLQQKIVHYSRGTIAARAVILCMGATHKTMGLDAERQFAGKGVSYCATCDGAFFKGGVATVLGGGDTALTDALYLSNLCKKVYLVVRRDKMRATQILQDRVAAAQNVEVLWESNIQDLQGEASLQSVVLSTKNGAQVLPTDALFVAIGLAPNSQLVQEKLQCENGYIITNEHMQVQGAEGVFAAGDIRKKALRQVVTACSDGAIAATSALEYLTKE